MTTLRYLDPNPWSLLDEISRVQRAFNTAFDPGTTTTRWPRLNATETKDGLTVEAELPGVDPKLVKVTVQEDELTISGEVAAREAGEGERLVRQERPTGAFERSVTLPFSVDTENVKAIASNGVLSIHMEKAATAKPRQVEVAAG